MKFQTVKFQGIGKMKCKDCCGKEISNQNDGGSDRSYELLDEKVASKLTEHSARMGFTLMRMEPPVPFKDPKSSVSGVLTSYRLPIGKPSGFCCPKRLKDTPNGSPLLNQLVNRRKSYSARKKNYVWRVASSAQATLSGSPFQKK